MPHFQHPSVVTAPFWRVTVICCLALITFLGGGQPTLAQQQATKSPSVVIETFAPEKGYIVGGESVVLLCVVRNVGADAVPENMLRLRCYPVSGLDYTNGNMLPTLPALAPGDGVAFRWRLNPSDMRMAPVAGVILEPLASAPDAPRTPQPVAQQPGPVSTSLPLLTPPQLAFAVVPRLVHVPGMGDVPGYKDPLAHAVQREDDALLVNGRVGVHVQLGERRDAILTLAAKEGANWQNLASSLGLVRLNAGEEGQLPWWQSFRCQRMRVQEDRDSATLTLNGNIGTACRAELTLEMRPDTCIIIGHLHLVALRALRVAGMELPVLLTAQSAIDVPPVPAGRADGSPTLLPKTGTLLPDDSRLAAVHGVGATFGVAWPDNPILPFVPISAWKWNRLPENTGVQAAGIPTGDAMASGSVIDCQFRLFAFAPSGTVRDALRFQIP